MSVGAGSSHLDNGVIEVDRWPPERPELAGPGARERRRQEQRAGEPWLRVVEEMAQLVGRRRILGAEAAVVLGAVGVFEQLARARVQPRGERERVVLDEVSASGQLEDGRASHQDLICSAQREPLFGEPVTDCALDDGGVGLIEPTVPDGGEQVPVEMRA